MPPVQRTCVFFLMILNPPEQAHSARDAGGNANPPTHACHLLALHIRKHTTMALRVLTGQRGGG